MGRVIGESIDRVDGRAKVTGAARYAAEFTQPNMAYAALALSTVTKGRVRRIDAREAERAPGVLAVLTHLNAPKLPYLDPKGKDEIAPQEGRPLRPLQDDVVRFNGQPIGVVIADTFERATHAASLLKVDYESETFVTKLEDELPRAFAPGPRASSSRGNPDAAFAQADVRVDETYTIPTEHHNPMEPHATIAVWEGEQLTVYDKSQFVDNVRQHLASIFGMPEGNVRVVSPFVGGAFGSALRPWPHVVVAALAARHVKRPVKLVLTREQMFTGHGYRPDTIQRVRLGASRDGRLSAIIHEGTAETSRYENYTESLLSATRHLYACPNLRTQYRLTRLDVATPTYMRGPGEVSGVFALECALDELAYALEIDPLELRLKNYAETNPHDGLPFSSKSLRECYRQGAARFGWDRRQAKPRSMRDGRHLVGYGMATATYPTNRAPSSALARLLADGSAVVQAAASDMGPGTYTTMTIIAADTLGLPVERVRFELGDTRLPHAPVHGGSMTTASVGSAVRAACEAVCGKVLSLARNDAQSPLKGATIKQVKFDEGRIFWADDPSRGETLAEILKRHNTASLEATVESKPGDEEEKFSMHAFGAQFAEVKVDPDLGTVRVARYVGAYAAGRIVNAKAARSQIIGGIVGGIGMALMEETVRDHRFGRIVNHNLAEYHVPVNADVPMLDPFFVEEVDPHVNPLGAKGIGEIAIVGVAPAIANAVYHATGRRVRDLPITLDKLLPATNEGAQASAS